MDFSLSEDQRRMQDETAKLLGHVSSLERVRKIVQSDNPSTLNPEIWDQLCHLGIQGLIIDQDYGGLGLGILDAALIAEQLGHFIVPAPFAGTSVMGSLAISLAGNSRQKEELLPKLANGKLIAAVAISEFAAGARENAGLSCQNGSLSGSNLFVIDCNNPDLIVVADSERKLHLVEAKADGLVMTPLETVDRTRSVCKIELSNVESQPLENKPSEALVRMRDAGRVILAADTLGCAWRMLDTAIEYAGQRIQFGRLIGSFQAIKHICADMAAELEPGRSLMWYAAHAQDQGLPDASLVTAHCKAYLCEAGRIVARKATEVHGGIGITDALGLHLWFKRIGLNYQLLGSPERLREEAARLQWSPESPCMVQDVADSRSRRWAGAGIHRMGQTLGDR